MKALQQRGPKLEKCIAKWVDRSDLTRSDHPPSHRPRSVLRFLFPVAPAAPEHDSSYLQRASNGGGDVRGTGVGGARNASSFEITVLLKKLHNGTILV